MKTKKNLSAFLLFLSLLFTVNLKAEPCGHVYGQYSSDGINFYDIVPGSDGLNHICSSNYLRVYMLDVYNNPVGFTGGLIRYVLYHYPYTYGTSTPVAGYTSGWMQCNPPGSLCDYVHSLSIPTLAAGDYCVLIERIDADENGEPDPNGTIDLLGCQDGAYYCFTVDPVLTNDLSLASYDCVTNEVCVNTQTESPLQNVVITFGDGSPGVNATTNLICHTYTISGPYTITQTVTSTNADAVCPDAITSIPINIGAPLSITLDPKNFMDCSSQDDITVTANVDGGIANYNYQWNVPTGDATPYGISPLTSSGNQSSSFTFSPSNAVSGIYTLTVTDGNQCTASIDFNVNLIPCCDNTDPAYTFISPDPANPKDLSTLGINFSSNTNVITLNGYFTVGLGGGTPFTTSIQNCEVQLGENSKIYVVPGAIFEIIGSHLYACDKMWDGIYLDDPTAQLSISSSSIISDALSAVNVSNDAECHIDESTFNDNLVSVYVHDCGTFPESITSNVFQSVNNLKAPYAGEPAGMGILISNVKEMHVGDAKTNPNFNTFQHLRIGILSSASNTIVHPNYFLDLENNLTPGIFDRTGIIANNGVFGPTSNPIGSLEVHGFETGTEPDAFATANINFRNMKTGIDLYGVDANDISGNYFDNITHATGVPVTLQGVGINIAECNSAYVNIFNNRFTNMVIGINATQNTDLKAYVLNNRIHGITGGFALRGVAISQYNSPINFQVGSNLLTNFRRGVDLLNTGSNVVIAENRIEMTTGNYQQAGIAAENCTGATISQNQIVGTQASTSNAQLGNPALRRTGIGLKTSQGNVIECNSIDNTTYGMRFQANNTPLDVFSIRGNHMHHHFYGWQLQQFGPDGFIGNVGTIDHTNSNTFIYTDPTKFSYTNSANAHTTTVNNNNGGSGQIFFQDIDGGDLAVGIGINPLFRLEPQNITNQPHDRFDCGTGYIDPFLFTEEDSSENGGEKMRAENVATGEAFENVEQEYKEVVKYEEEKATFEKLKEKPALRNQSSILDEFFTEKQQEVIGKMKELKTAIRELSDTLIMRNTVLRAQKLAEIATKRSAVLTTKNFEYNEKKVAEIYTNMVGKGIKLTDSLAYKNYITWLAHQCPLLQGNSVYEARSLYALINPNEMYDDDQLCDGMFKKEREETIARIETRTDIHLQPNPAKNSTTLYYEFAETDKVNLAVTNSLGEIVYSTSVPTTQYSFTIFTNNFASGIYSYNLTVNDKPTKRDKFVVIK